jgi:polar amino acid transport system substrate-binding protein
VWQSVTIQKQLRFTKGNWENGGRIMNRKMIAAMMAAAMVVSMGSATVCMAEEERTTFVVGFDAEYPPYGYMDDDGEYTGFDLELAEAVCEMEGWELEKKPINWDSKDMELNSGSIDCIWSGFTMNGREDDYTFSIPYVDNSQVIVVAEDSGIDTLEDLAGKIVGVQAASAAEDLLKSEEEGGQKALADTFAELDPFADYNTAFTELQAGALDALAIDIGVAKYQLNSRGEGFKILDESLNTEQYAVGFRLGDDELCEIVNKDLQELANNGTVAELAEKYEIADMVSLKAEDAEESADAEEAADDTEEAAEAEETEE